MTETTPTAPEGPTPVKYETPEEPKGHAVYDLTLTRYVSGVYPTKAKAEEAVTKAKGHKYETRQV